MFRSKFDALAEIEALRAGFKPSGVRSPRHLPTLSPAAPDGAPSRPTPECLDEESIRLEMERRCMARLASLSVA